MRLLYPPYRLAPVRLRHELELHAGHELTVVRTEDEGTLLHCLTCGVEVVDIERREPKKPRRTKKEQTHE